MKEDLKKSGLQGWKTGKVGIILQPKSKDRELVITGREIEMLNQVPEYKVIDFETGEVMDVQRTDSSKTVKSADHVDENGLTLIDCLTGTRMENETVISSSNQLNDSVSSSEKGDVFGVGPK